MSKISKKTLIAVGDVMVERPLETDTMSEFGDENTVLMGNLELPLTSSGSPADKPIVFKASPKVALELRKAGFSVLSVANNHALDYGIEGLLKTVEVLEESSIASIGGGRDLRAALSPYYETTENGTVGFIALSSTLPTGSPATEDRPGIAPVRVNSSFVVDGPTTEEQPGTSPYVSTRVEEEYLEQAMEAVGKAKKDCDLLILSIHWGVPPEWVAPAQGILAEYQRPLAHKLIESGVDLIFGHHPHVVQGVEIYRESPIFYSLGNFIFHPFGKRGEIGLNRPVPYNLDQVDNPEIMDSIIVRCPLFDGTEKKFSLEDIALIPFHLDENGESKKSPPGRAKETMKRVEKHSRLLGTKVSIGVNGEGKLISPKKQ